jgi:hypothetical protein
MRRTKGIVAGVLVLCLAAGVLGCVLEEKVIDIVVKNETFVEFAQRDTSASQVTPSYLDVADRIDEILADNDLWRGDIVSARLASCSYGVTRFWDPAGDHDDWEVSGYVTIERTDKKLGSGRADSAVIVNHTWLSVKDALGQRIVADLDSAGVAVLHRAFDDYIDDPDAYPELEFNVHNGVVTPTPSGTDTMKFDWTAWLLIDVVVRDTLELPDLF